MLSQKWWFILFFFIFAPLLLVKIILMKRNVTFLRALITSSLIFISFLSFSQSVDNEVIMNLGFERWVSDGPFKGEPEHWHGISSASGTYKGLLTKPQMEMSRITRPGSEGNYSVRLFPRSIFGVVVNGTFTNGRVNAGSMIPDNKEDNYAYTCRVSPDFSTPINIVPDSVALWVCFRAKEQSSEANFVAVVHGDADFRYSGPGYSSPQDSVCAVAGPCHFTRSSPANSNEFKWKRISIPFVKNYDVEPRYILFLFSTNKTAGGGSSKDELFIDDIEFIYNKK